MPAAKRKGVQFCPVITGPSPQMPDETPQKTSELSFQAYDPANPKHKQNKPRASSKEATNIEALPSPANMALSVPMFDATAALVPQHLSYHFYSSFRPASHEQPLGRENVNEVIRQTVPEETMAERTHVPNANKTETAQIPKIRSGPAAKESEARRDSGLKKGLTTKKQRYQSPEEPEKFTTQNTVRAIDVQPFIFDLESAIHKHMHAPMLELLADMNGECEESDDSLNPNTSIETPDGSKKPTQKPSIRTKIAHVQNGSRANRRNAPRQRKRYIEDNSDDEEEKFQVPARMQKGATRLQSKSTAARVKTEEAHAPADQKRLKRTKLSQDISLIPHTSINASESSGKSTWKPDVSKEVLGEQKATLVSISILPNPRKGKHEMEGGEDDEAVRSKMPAQRQEGVTKLQGSMKERQAQFPNTLGNPVPKRRREVYIGLSDSD